MVDLARDYGSVIHVVLPREAGVVQHAREAANAIGVAVTVDLMAATIRVRLDGAAAH